jgi:hypothetical protein
MDAVTKTTVLVAYSYAALIAPQVDGSPPRSGEPEGRPPSP